HQVQKRLLEEFDVEIDRRQVGRQEAADLDAGLFRGRGEEIDHLLDHGGQVRRPQVEVAQAGEPQKVVGDFDEPLAFALEAADAVEGPAFAVRLGLGEVFGQQLQVQAERG